MKSLLDAIKQNDKLPIRLVTPGFGHLTAEEISKYGYNHRRAHYFFLFMVNGCMQHRVDLQQIDVNTHELLVVLPHQMLSME
jgi:AraC family transcriptional regulator, transcriptional activator of pobA